MAGEDKPELPEGESADAERRFNETLGRLVNTPHKPHKAKTPPSEPRGVRASEKK
jgi:hypothetical protein